MFIIIEMKLLLDFFLYFFVSLLGYHFAGGGTLKRIIMNWIDKSDLVSGHVLFFPLHFRAVLGSQEN